MIFLPHDRASQHEAAVLTRRPILPNGYDLIALAILVALMALLAHGAEQMRAPAQMLSTAPVTLDIANLPEYALRMFAAIIASLVFTFTVATLAAKSRRAEMDIIPALDILQSVPVLGFSIVDEDTLDWQAIDRPCTAGSQRKDADAGASSSA